MSDCIHGLEDGTCALCLGTSRPKRPPVEEGPTIVARFGGGRCVAGDDRIFEGEDIVRTDQGWAHPECAALR